MSRMLKVCADYIKFVQLAAQLLQQKKIKECFKRKSGTVQVKHFSNMNDHGKFLSLIASLNDLFRKLTAGARQTEVETILFILLHANLIQCFADCNK